MIKFNSISDVSAPRISICMMVTIVVLAYCANSRADQSDPKLDALFVQLRAATNPVIARRTEREIWAIWQHPPNDTARQMMRHAQAALDQRDFESAIRLLDKLVAHSPNFAEAWNQRAIVQYFAADYDASLSDIEQTLALEPRHFGAMAGRGQVYLHLNELELALQAFEDALEWNPWMANVRGQIYRIRELISARPKPI